MKLDQQKLDQLIAAGKTKYPAGHFVLNFYQPLDNAEFGRLLDNILIRENDFFYCHQPSESFLFLAADKLVSVYDEHDLSSSKFQTSIEAITNKTVSNRSEFKLRRNPFFVGATKFPSVKNEPMWEEFNKVEWYLPKMFLIKEHFNHYLVINSFYYDGFEKYIAYALNRINDARGNNLETVTPQAFASTEISFEEWSKELDSALNEISSGNIKKVVLARYADFQLSQNSSLPTLLHELEENYNECYTFAFRSGGSTFFGSTPEKLFRIHDDVIETDALAGSFPRGETPEMDSSLENNLLNDQKNLEEHRSVVEFLTSRLSEVSDKISNNNHPTVKKFSNIQHLYTPIKAEIRNGVSALSVIDNLYPTPAVCGMPSSTANQVIDNLETFERGLYAGALGWMGIDNSAEIFVGIRSALIKDNFMRAFAGCGIVTGSKSLSEFNETALKLKPILSLFKNETINQP